MSKPRIAVMGARGSGARSLVNRFASAGGDTVPSIDPQYAHRYVVRVVTSKKYANAFQVDYFTDGKPSDMFRGRDAEVVAAKYRSLVERTFNSDIQWITFFVTPWENLPGGNEVVLLPELTKEEQKDPEMRLPWHDLLMSCTYYVYTQKMSEDPGKWAPSVCADLRTKTVLSRVTADRTPENCIGFMACVTHGKLNVPAKLEERQKIRSIALAALGWPEDPKTEFSYIDNTVQDGRLHVSCAHLIRGLLKRVHAGDAIQEEEEVTEVEDHDEEEEEEQEPQQEEEGCILDLSERVEQMRQLSEQVDASAGAQMDKSKAKISELKKSYFGKEYSTEVGKVVSTRAKQSDIAKELEALGRERCRLSRSWAQLYNEYGHLIAAHDQFRAEQMEAKRAQLDQLGRDPAIEKLEQRIAGMIAKHESEMAVVNGIIKTLQASATKPAAPVPAATVVKLSVAPKKSAAAAAPATKVDSSSVAVAAALGQKRPKIAPAAAASVTRKKITIVQSSEEEEEEM